MAKKMSGPVRAFRIVGDGQGSVHDDRRLGSEEWWARVWGREDACARRRKCHLMIRVGSSECIGNLGWGRRSERSEKKRPRSPTEAMGQSPLQPPQPQPPPKGTPVNNARGPRERDACSCEQFDVFPKRGLLALPPARSLAHPGTMAMEEEEEVQEGQWGGREGGRDRIAQRASVQADGRADGRTDGRTVEGGRDRPSNMMAVPKIYGQ